jgi:hypothetical protein
MTVMEECHRQIQDITGKQKEKVDELNAEIRKLKAMIGTSSSFTFLSSYLIPDFLIVVSFFSFFFLPLSVCVFSVLSSFLFYSFSFFLIFLLSFIVLCLVKHETRIRSLETKNKEQEKQLMSQVPTKYHYIQNQ